MKVTATQYTITDLYSWYKEKSLVIKKEYQRGERLWPNNARSYFIDTILNDYPFPKITMRQTVDLKTKKQVKEIVDGQQRMLSIFDFIDNKLVLSSVSREYKGLRFDALDPDASNNFMVYYVSVDLITAAANEEIYEIFRRMNSYTLPLNDAEKRHATYQGEFKWFIRDLINRYSHYFETYSIFTNRQLTRMQDADLLTELIQILIDGIENKSNRKLDDIYKKNDKNIINKVDIVSKLDMVLNFIFNELHEVCESELLNSYLFYSLFAALTYCRWGINNIMPEKVSELTPINAFVINIDNAKNNLLMMLTAAAEKDEEGEFREFVKACSASTHRIKSRESRLKWFVMALQDNLM